MNRRENWDGEVFDEAQSQSQANILKILWQRKLYVLPAVILALALGAIHHSRQVPIYKSSARVLVTQTGPMLPMGGLQSQLGVMPQHSPGPTHVLLIRSPLIVQHAVSGRKFDSSVEDLGELIDEIAAHTGTESPQPTKSTTNEIGGLQNLESLAGSDPVSTIIRGLQVGLAGQAGDVLDLSYQGTHPDDCRLILQAVVEAYQGYLEGSRRTVTTTISELMNRAQGDLAEELYEKQANHAAFQRKHPSLLLKGDSGESLYHDRIADIESARNELRDRRTELTSQIRILEEGIKQGGSHRALLAALGFNAESATESFTPITMELLPLQTQYAQLRQMYGEDHPEIMAVRQEMEVTRRILAEANEEQKEYGKNRSTPAELIKIVHESLQTQLSILADQLRELNLQFAEQQEQAEELLTLETQDEQLRQEIDRIQDLHDSVLKGLEGINLNDDLGGYEADLISPPKPGVQVAPDLMRTLMTSFALGLMGGFGIAYLVEMADKRFRSAEDLRRALGLPLIGHIPRMAPDKARLQAADSDFAPVLATFHRPSSGIAEAFRAVRTALYFTTSGQGHQVVQITSPTPGDGKSTLAANLAISIAQSNKEVLLIDADCRLPTIHKLFGIDREVGLSSVIGEGLEPLEAVRTSSISCLHVMTAGPPTPNPSELLTSPRFQELVETLREKFEYVILDSPPLLAVSDTSAVAARADGTILVLQLGKKSRATAIRAGEMLESLNANVLGIVVNGVSSGQGYGYGSGGYSGYGYGYGGYGGYGYGGYGRERDSVYGEAERDSSVRSRFWRRRSRVRS